MTTTEQRLSAYRRTIAIIAVIVFAVLAFMIIRPFLVAIIGAAVLGYLFHPVYKFIAKYIPKPLPAESISAFLTCILIILIVLIPMISITGLLVAEARSGYIYLQKVVTAPDFRFDLPPIVNEHIGDLSIQYKDQIANLGSQLVKWLQGVLTGIPNVFLNIFITIFSVYFVLRGGGNINKFIQEFFPLPGGRYKQIFKRFDELSRGMVMGQIVVGLIQGVLAWIAFVILGVPSPVLWAFLTGIISIIPLLGAALVWFPIAVYLFSSGYIIGTAWKGIALLLYGILVISTVDNFLKPKIIGERAKIHPLVILFGILGGIQLMGLPGILMGPLILTLFDVVMEIFREVV
ncbi:MAG: AI-2E family transporter [Candidatus Margulisbacteria bacterium]|nr:AI-2E family transporter [Candidatus Margulisiibacteriota bacterium]